MAVITISRQYATNGIFFGKKLSEKLNYAFVNKDIYKRVSETENISIEELKAMESISGLGIDFFQRLIDSDYIKRITGRKDVSFEHNEVVKAVEQAIKDIAKTGNVIILGRAAQCILQDEENVFHIKLIKSYDDRLKFLTERGITRKGAESTIKRKDEERENYIKRFYGKDWNSPELYHLVLNLSKVSVTKGMEIVASLIS